MMDGETDTKNEFCESLRRFIFKNKYKTKKGKRLSEGSFNVAGGKSRRNKTKNIMRTQRHLVEILELM